MTIIDPMHNLMMNVWSSLKLIDSTKLLAMQQAIPSKIASGFSGFTAEQWRNWTILYSLSALKDVLPREHFNCWHLFVRACHLLCSCEVMYNQVENADELLNSFCVAFESLYGKQYCTINLHLHGHLASCIEDFWACILLLAFCI